MTATVECSPCLIEKECTDLITPAVRLGTETHTHGHVQVHLRQAHHFASGEAVGQEDVKHKQGKDDEDPHRVVAVRRHVRGSEGYLPRTLTSISCFVCLARVVLSHVSSGSVRRSCPIHSAEFGWMKRSRAGRETTGQINFGAMVAPRKRGGEMRL